MIFLVLKYLCFTLYWGVIFVNSFRGTSVPITPRSIPVSDCKYSQYYNYDEHKLVMSVRLHATGFASLEPGLN